MEDKLFAHKTTHTRQHLVQGKYGLLSIFPTLLYFMKQTHCFPGFFSASDTHRKVCKVSVANNDICTLLPHIVFTKRACI